MTSKHGTVEQDAMEVIREQEDDAVEQAEARRPARAAREPVAQEGDVGAVAPVSAMPETAVRDG